MDAPCPRLNHITNSDASSICYLRPDPADPFSSNDANKYVIDPGHQSFFTNLKAAALVLNNTDAIIAGTELNGFDTHKGQGGATGNNPNTHPQLNKAIGWAMYALKK